MEELMSEEKTINKMGTMAVNKLMLGMGTYNNINGFTGCV